MPQWYDTWSHDLAAPVCDNYKQTYITNGVVHPQGVGRKAFASPMTNHQVERRTVRYSKYIVIQLQSSGRLSAFPSTRETWWLTNGSNSKILSSTIIALVSKDHASVILYVITWPSCTSIRQLTSTTHITNGLLPPQRHSLRQWPITRWSFASLDTINTYNTI